MEESYGSRVRDATGEASEDADRRPDERGGKSEHPAEFYAMPPPASLMDIA
jgi:hypothetical protein